jgi:hypothetical protein
MVICASAAFRSLAFVFTGAEFDNAIDPRNRISETSGPASPDTPDALAFHTTWNSNQFAFWPGDFESVEYADFLVADYRYLEVDAYVGLVVFLKAYAGDVVHGSGTHVGYGRFLVTALTDDRIEYDVVFHSSEGDTTSHSGSLSYLGFGSNEYLDIETGTYSSTETRHYSEEIEVMRPQLDEENHWYTMSWSQAAAAVPGLFPRTDFGTAVHAGRMWVVSGNDENGVPYGDIWSSPDGDSWAQVHAGEPVFSHANPGFAAFDGHLYLYDPTTEELHSSTDGVNWIPAGFPGFGMQNVRLLASDDTLFAISAANGAVWSSTSPTDLLPWQQIDDGSAFPGGDVADLATTIHGDDAWIVARGGACPVPDGNG